MFTLVHLDYSPKHECKQEILTEANKDNIILEDNITLKPSAIHDSGDSVYWQSDFKDKCMPNAIIMVW